MGGGNSASTRVVHKVGSEDWFREKFEEESDGLETLESDKLEKLFEALGMDVPEEEGEKSFFELSYAFSNAVVETT